MKKILRVFNSMLELYKGDQILIYQMGKVGSSTLEKSINKLGLDVRHIHSFGNTNNYKFSGKREIRGIKIRLISKIYKFIFRIRRKKIKVITLMRDPVSRNISTMFQEVSLMLHLHEKEDNRRSQELDIMLNDFLDRYVDSEIPIKWFDEELKYFTGIDIFNFTFDKEKGSLHIKEGKVELLVLTAEKLNYNKDIIIEFINNDKFEFINSNVSNEKWYSEIYNKFRNNYKINSEKTEQFYNSKTVRYFYTKEDIKKFKDKWSR